MACQDERDEMTTPWRWTPPLSLKARSGHLRDIPFLARPPVAFRVLLVTYPVDLCKSAVCDDRKRSARP